MNFSEYELRKVFLICWFLEQCRYNGLGWAQHHTSNGLQRRRALNCWQALDFEACWQGCWQVVLPLTAQRPMRGQYIFPTHLQNVSKISARSGKIFPKYLQNKFQHIFKIFARYFQNIQDMWVFEISIPAFIILNYLMPAKSNDAKWIWKNRDMNGVLTAKKREPGIDIIADNCQYSFHLFI